MDTILNKLERGCGIGAALSGDSKWAQETMTEAKTEIERLRKVLGRIATGHHYNDAKILAADALKD